MFTKIIKALNGFVERLTPKQLLMGTIVAGVLIFLMVYLTLNHIEQSLIAEQPEPVEMTQVVVARVNIPRGVPLQENMLKVKEFAVRSLPPGTASDVQLFVGLPTKLEIFEGDILTTKKVFTDYREAGFIGMIPSDCRAVSIPIDNVTGIAGLIKAGDYVDVILVSSAGNAGTKAEVILQNILLLSINKNADREIQNDKDNESNDKKEVIIPDSDVKKGAEDLISKGEKINKDAADSFEGKGAKGLGAAGGGANNEDLGTVTLALKPDDVVKIAAATEVGTIHLALRPLKPQGDSMYIEETDYYISTRNNYSSQSFLERQNREYQPVETRPAPVRVPAANLPTPAFTPPASPVTPKPPATGGSQQNGGYEVIQWGS